MHSFKGMAPVGVGMHPEMQNEMMQEYHQELDNMRASQESHTPPYEIAAIDADGNELYRTESFVSREAAQAECDVFDEGDAYWTDNIDDEVDHFEPRKKE